MRRLFKRQTSKSQYVPLRPVRGTQFVDIHCHCLPGLDDGPENMAEAVSLCRALQLDGIKTVIATPHQLGQYDGQNEAGVIRQAVSELNEVLKGYGIPIDVLAGADVRVDERLVRMLDDDLVLTLADGGRYILLELPHDIFIDISEVLDELSSRGIKAIISHPERHRVIAKEPGIINGWLQKGAILQITAGSLTGDFGTLAEKAGWHLLDSGVVAVVATDAHNLHNRHPRMFEAYGLIMEHLGKTFARQVCLDNPMRIRTGDNVKAVTKLMHEERTG